MDGQECEQLTLFPESVTTVILPGTSEAERATADSGRACLGFSKSAGPLGALEEALLTSARWSSKRCYLTWKIRRTPGGRPFFQLQPSGPDRRDPEPQFVLTPTASDWKRLHITEQAQRYKYFTLQSFLSARGLRGYLNVNWTEWLMGFPPGWTRPGQETP